jgi:hypothetical protein
MPKTATDQEKQNQMQPMLHMVLRDEIAVPQQPKQTAI